MSKSIAMNMIMIGPMKQITEEELAETIKQHEMWIEDNTKGKRADLSKYDLSDKDLSGANLSGAILEGANLTKTKMTGINLTGAIIRDAHLANVDLTDAVLDHSDFHKSVLNHSNLTNVQAVMCNFAYCNMWNNNYTNAKMITSNFLFAKLCDGNFESADLRVCNFFGADLDYASFKNANLESVILKNTKNIYWANFEGANMKCALIEGCDIGDDKVKNVRELNLIRSCPDEGSFVAWRKNSDNKIVKVMIPENAKRTGKDSFSSRASEVIILEIYDENGICSETSGFGYDEMIYHKGDIVKVEKYNDSMLHNGDGIDFVFSRKEAELWQYKTEETGV